MKDSKSYILFLPSWFPSRGNGQNGDFIYRHSLAVSQFQSIYLLNIYRSNNYNLTGYDYYYCESDSTFCNFGYFNTIKSSILNVIKYFYFYYRETRKVFKTGKPDLVHVHVSYKAGLYALWLKFRYHIPYIVSEHWTFFTEERIDNYAKSNFFMKFILKIIFNNSSCVLPVSINLSNQLKLYFPNINSVVIPNVVDPGMFYYDIKRLDSNCFRFIHVSSLNKLKNPLKIIKVFDKIKAIYGNVVLDMVGPANDELLNMIKKLGLGSEAIFLHGLKKHEEVAEIMQLANAFVLFSDYETQSCVSIEALCCGLPVISSRLPCLEEFISEENGLLVSPGDEDALYNAMESMILNYKNYDRKKISETAQAKYNPDVVGKQIVKVYEKVLSK